MTTSTVTPAVSYEALADAVLAGLRSERDRQIVARRYSLGLDKRQTLEQIGQEFGITRERVRQIEKSATAKLSQNPTPELRQINDILLGHLRDRGDVALVEEVSAAMGASAPSQQAYIVFLATLAPDVEVIESNDDFHTTISSLPEFDQKRLQALVQQLTTKLGSHGKPLSIDGLQAKAAPEISVATVQQLARASKQLTDLEGEWGLTHWPTVNPRSIRDKTYLVLNRHGKPLHFSEIANRIGKLGQNKRGVTVQAVHNELIKDPRFVLVGRGIYALADWGYTPGTVADIITEVLGQESPLHKNEIIKRVLEKRQVKSTTIMLNLQEKDQFVRVAKATYALR